MVKESLIKMAASLSPLSLSSIFKPKTLCIFTAQKPFSPLRSPSLASSHSQPPILRFYNRNPPLVLTTKRWKFSASNYDFFLSEANPVENSQEIIIPPSDDGVSTVISGLLLIAFIALSILTVGVIYIAVTDFLQKREREKCEKEEASKKKKGGKKGNVRARSRAGPRGFGQKIEDDDDIGVDGTD